MEGGEGWRGAVRCGNGSVRYCEIVLLKRPCSPEFPTLSVAKPTRSDPSRAGPLSLTVSLSGTDTAKPSPNHFFKATMYMKVHHRCSAHETHCHGIFI